MRRLLLAVCLSASAVLAVPAAGAYAQTACPGAQPGCPYSSSFSIGQRGGGVLRFPQAVAVGPDGSVYVGDQGSHVVQVFASDGAFLREIGVAGSRPGELTAVGALAIASDGSLLVADGSNRIDRLAPDGRVISSFGRSGSDVGEFRFGGGRGNDAGAGGGLAVSGTFVYVADSGNDRIQRFALDGAGGAVIVPPGLLANPKGLAVRKTRLLVADDQNHRVVALDLGGRFLRAIGAGSGRRPGQLNFPYGVALDAPGRLFVADNLNHRVVRFSTQPDYPYKGRWGSYGTQPGQLAYPRGIALDAAGLVYVANTGNDRIEVFDRGGSFVRAFGASGRGPGQFGTPMGVAADASGVRAVADSVNGRIQLFAPDGTLLTQWGSPAPGPTVLPRAVAVAFDGGGSAYVLDRRRARIVVFDRATGLPARTIASQGSGPGQLQDPSALAIDASGTVWVADSGNGRIARFATDGAYLGSITGTGAVRGVALSPDGLRVYATAHNTITVYDRDGRELTEFGGTGNGLGKLNAPAQLTVDAAGEVWVADRGNNRVQRFGPQGERRGTFGTRGTGDGQFVHPTGVSIDCNGLLTVSDASNNRVQQFTLSTPQAPACIALPPLGTPPPPKLPVLPTPDGPLLSARPLRTSGLLGSGGGVPVRVGCDTACTVGVTVRLTPRAKPPRKRKRVTITVSARARAVMAGETAVARAVLSRRQRTILRRALRGRRGLDVTVQAVASSAVGEPTTVALRLRATA